MIKNIDAFGKNVIFVFLGMSLVNIFNLLYQLLIAHRFSPADFAAFNSMLSIYLIVSMSLGTVQVALAKYTAEFNAHNQTKKIRFLLSSLLKKTTLFALLTLIIFYFASSYLIDKLKITSVASGYILAILLALSWVIPVLFGGIQGLELFKWLPSIQVISGVIKLILAFLFILFGFNIAGALGALLIANIIALVISYIPLKNFISSRFEKEEVNLKEFFVFLYPVAISTFCFIVLVNSDMILVKYFFAREEAGVYSIAQMVGKIFLFLPWAVGIVMFPRVSGLNAKNMDTAPTLYRSLFYVTILCVIACLGYNAFPALTLKILTGKVPYGSIFLARLFSISMSFFTLSYILITYFLSKRDLRFVRYLASFTLLQVSAIVLFHRNLVQVQLILCLNAILLFLIQLFLVYKKEHKGLSPKGTVPVEQ